MKTLLKINAGLLAGLVLLLVAYAGFNWVPDRPVDELKARWAPPPSQFVDVAGMKIHLRDEGPREDPSPIILLHGTSASLHTWDGWTESLKQQKRVIRFDLPGFGLTGPTPDGDYYIEKYVQVLGAVLDRLGVQRCVLTGNSFGGYVAWASALLKPEWVEKLVLVDAGGYAYKSASVPLAFRIARIPVLNRMMANVLPRSLIEKSVRNVYGDPAKVTPELVDRYFDLATRAGNRRALTERFKQADPGALAERVPELKLPTLILWGGQDRLIPPEFGQRFHREIAGSQLLMFDDLGHVPQEEDPARTVNTLKLFLDLQ